MEAFSAPVGLFEEAKVRAARLGFSKSGYYRYALAKDLGRTEEEAIEIARHSSVRKLRESVGKAHYGNGSLAAAILNEKPLK